MSPDSSIDRRPLSETEHVLIRFAESTAWHQELREMLARCVEARGGRVRAYDHPGDLVDWLRQAVAKSDKDGPDA